jgi:hypothetical protein
LAGKGLKAKIQSEASKPADTPLAKLAANAQAVSVVLGTIKAATMLAAGQTATGANSAQVAALTEGVVSAMFLSKLKLPVALLVIASLFAFGGGVAWYEAAAGQSASGEERPTLLPGQQKKGAKQNKKGTPKPDSVEQKNDEPGAEGEAKAADILKAFQTNAALFDDKYGDKRLKVTGKLLRIIKEVPHGGGLGVGLNNPANQAGLPGFPAAPNEGEPKALGYVLELACAKPGADPKEDWISIECVFSDKDRKELAQLSENLVVTIEGQCKVTPRRVGAGLAPIGNGLGGMGGGGFQGGFGAAGGFQGGFGGFPGGAGFGGNQGGFGGGGFPGTGGTGGMGGIGGQGFPGAQAPSVGHELDITFLNSKIVRAEK